MANSWILKSEPSTYSWSDLLRDRSTAWDGVANAAALINLRAMGKGDEILVYHSGDEKAIVGIAKVLRAAYPDPALDDPRRVVVDVAAVSPVRQPVTLGQIKAESRLAQLGLVRQSRLSCMPVNREQRALLARMGAR